MDFSLPPLRRFLLPRRSTQIKTYSWDNAQVVLAGNKCDMEEERVVSVDSGRLLAEQLGKSGATMQPLLLLTMDKPFSQGLSYSCACTVTAAVTCYTGTTT